VSHVIRITRLASALTLLSACLEPPGLDDGGTTGTLTLPGSRAVVSAPLAEGEQSSYLHAEGVVAFPGLIKGEYYTAIGTAGTFAAARR